MLYNLTIKNHADFSQRFRYGFGGLCAENFTPYDLTGWSAECRFYLDDFDTPLLVANTANGKITLNAEGEVGILLTVSDVALLTNLCKYRLILIRPDGYKIVVLFGEVVLL